MRYWDICRDISFQCTAIWNLIVFGVPYGYDRKQLSTIWLCIERITYYIIISPYILYISQYI